MNAKSHSQKIKDDEKFAGQDSPSGEKGHEDLTKNDVSYLKSIIENQEEFIVRFSLDGKINFTNQPFCDLVNISQNRLLGRSLSSTFSFQLFPDMHQALTKILATPERVIMEEGMILRNGARRWIQWTGFPIIAPDHSVTEIQAVGHDITLLKRAEETICLQRDLAILLVELKEKPIDYARLGQIFSSLSSFSFFAFYQLSADQTTYELKDRQSVLKKNTEMPKQIQVDSAPGKRFQQQKIQFVSVDESKEPPLFADLNPSIKGIAIVPIHVEAVPFAAIVFGSVELTELPNEIREQLCFARRQLENFFIQFHARAELYQHESDLLELFGSLEQMLLVINDEGVVLDANRALNEKLPDLELRQGLTIFDLHPVDQAQHICEAIAELPQKRHSALTLPFLARDNSTSTVEASFSFTSWEGKDRIVVIYKDISQQVHTHEMEREQRELASNLVAIAGILNSSLDLEIVLDRIMDSVDKIVPIITANILLVDANQTGKVIRQRGYERLGTEEAFTYRVFDLKKTKSFAKMLAGQPDCLISDTRAYPDWAPMPEFLWVRSYISAPIVVRGKVYAFLNCDHAIPGFFNESHATRLKLLADQAAIAIENALVYAETKNRLRQIALITELTHTMISLTNLDQIWNAIPQKILEVFDAHSIMITQWIPETKTVLRLLSFGEGVLPGISKSFSSNNDSITEYVIHHKHALLINSDEAYNAWTVQTSRIFSDRVVIALPMVAENRSFGAIIIGFKEPREITPTDVSFGEFVSLQIATILDKTELYQKAQQQTAQFQHANDLIASLSYVATTIMSAKGPDDIIQTMGNGLEKMNMHSFLFFKENDNQLSLGYCSRTEQLYAMLKGLGVTPQQKVILPMFDSDEFRSTVHDQQIVFIDDPVQLLRQIIPTRFGPFVNKFQEAMDFTTNSKSLLLPLIVEKKTTGLLGLYGENLQEVDQRAGEIFSSQISVALENARLISEVQRLAITDELTGVNNRRGLFEKGNRELILAKRLSHPLAALMIDLDNFKDVNDKYGHAIGDIALRETVRRICKNIRDIDLIGRYGGEEFVVLLVGDELSEALKVAKRINTAVGREEILTEAGPIQVTVSVGVDELDAMTLNLGMLIKRADRALYIAKHNGRNQVATLLNIENLDSQKGTDH